MSFQDWFRWRRKVGDNSAFSEFAAFAQMLSAWRRLEFSIVDELGPAFSESADPTMRASAQMALADSAILVHSRYSDASNHLEQVLASNTFPDLRQLNLSNLGKAYALNGEYEKARTAYLESLGILRAVEQPTQAHRNEQSTLYARLGEAFSEQGWFDEAHREFDLADQLAESARSDLRIAANHMLRAECYRLSGDFERSAQLALQARQEHLDLAPRSGYAEDARHCLIVAVRSLARLGPGAEARRQHSLLATVQSEVTPEQWELSRIADYEVSVAESDSQRLHDLERWFESTELHSRPLAAEFAYAIGRRRLSGDDPATAQDPLEFALQFYEAIEHRTLVPEIRRLLAN